MLPAIDVIINARSGATTNEGLRRQLVDIFGSSGIEARISLAKNGVEVAELARRAVSGDAQSIVAGGGDGTINAVASELVGTNRTLGVLPLGTFNHFARDLGIPLDVDGAARTIIAGHVMTIDVGEVNGHIFLNNSSLGLYPRIVRQRDRKMRLGHGKRPAFLWAALAVLRRYPFMDVRLSVDGNKFETRTPFVFIGNNEYEIDGFTIGRRPRLDDGQLSLYVTHHTGRMGLVRLAFRALFRRLRDAEDFLAVNTRDVRVETRRRRVRVSTDGEVSVMKPPLDYRIRAGALRVIVHEGRESETN